MSISLLCFIKHGNGIVVEIRVQARDTIAWVRDMIYEKQKSYFELYDIPSAFLDLYAPSELSAKSKRTLIQRVDSIDLKTALGFTDTVQVVFRPEELDMSLIHLVVVPRQIVVPAKRPRPNDGGDIYDIFRESKLANTAPSDFANASRYRVEQEDANKKILDDRPKPDEDIPPIALLYRGFGYFLDICRGHADVPGLERVRRSDIELAVDAFAEEMCDFRDENEDVRRDRGLPLLRDIFSARIGARIPPVMAASIGSVISDGHFLGDHGAACFAVIFKNEVCSFKTIPAVQVAGYIARSLHAVDRKLFLGWRIPSLGLTVVGPNITFYAVLALDHQVRLIPLTSTLSCLPNANDGDDRKMLCTAFTAASVLTACILEDATRFQTTPPPAIHADLRRFPAVTELRKFKADGCISFQIEKFYPDRQPYRLLYIAETKEDRKKILVKFIRRYCIDLHAFCAERGHAPCILGFERLPGGWNAIAMEYVSSAVPIIHSSGLARHGERWMKELRELVDSFHGEGFVHGDLRDANIICDKDSIFRLMDFDWAGKDGEVSYSADDNLNPELLQDRTTTDLTITKGDDDRVLKVTLDKISASFGAV